MHPSNFCRNGLLSTQLPCCGEYKCIWCLWGSYWWIKGKCWQSHQCSITVKQLDFFSFEFKLTFRRFSKQQIITGAGFLALVAITGLALSSKSFGWESFDVRFWAVWCLSCSSSNPSSLQAADQDHDHVIMKDDNGLTLSASDEYGDTSAGKFSYPFLGECPLDAVSHFFIRTWFQKTLC